jgi:cytochrome P450/NADPH-cytochrome P450 reductase
VELSTPASQRQILHLASTNPGAEGEKLKALASDERYHSEILEKRVSLLDLLEDFPQCKLSLGTYLDLLPPLAPRQYSISSSPLANSLGTSKTQEQETPVASITYDVFETAALSGHGRTFKGVASTFLASQGPGSNFRCFVRPTNVSFHLPSSPLTPIIMIATGTGIAPMRGFLQERATLASARGAGALGQAILYFGCRDHEADFLYRDELAAWEAAGVVKVRACFSRSAPAGQDTKYVPDAIWEDREELSDLFKHQGAKVFVCGSASKLGRSSADAVVRVYRDKTGKSEEEAREWLDGIREERYVSDVFG